MMEIINGKPYGEVPGNNWTSRLQRKLRIPLGRCRPVWAFSVETSMPFSMQPRVLQWSGDYYSARDAVRWEKEWLFRNSYLFFRICAPFCVCFSVRWSGSKTKKSHFDFVLGWRQNGVLGASFRLQSDESSAAGFDIPNLNQAQGWEPGWR